jgi:hypothetical protein
MEIVVQRAPTLGTICRDVGHVANAAIMAEVHADGAEFNGPAAVVSSSRTVVCRGKRHGVETGHRAWLVEVIAPLQRMAQHRPYSLRAVGDSWAKACTS